MSTFPFDQYRKAGAKAHSAGRPGTEAEALIDLSSWLQEHPEFTGACLIRAWLSGWNESERAAIIRREKPDAYTKG